MSYSDIHRAFLQAILNIGSLKTAAALSLLGDIELYYNDGEDGSAIDEKQLRKIVSDINSKIYPFEQSMNFHLYDLKGEDEEYLVFVSSNHSDQIK